MNNDYFGTTDSLEERYWRADDDSGLVFVSWLSWGGPEEGITFHVVKNHSRFTLPQIADALDGCKKGLNDFVGQGGEDWEVCRDKVYRRVEMCGPWELICELEQDCGFWRCKPGTDDVPDDKDIRRLERRGCSHHKRFCIRK
jgi:hypothetical protein